MIDDTIAAVATALGEGGIGIIRLSGEQSLAIADKVFRGSRTSSVNEIPSYHAAYGKAIDPQTEEVIDEVLILVMRGPRSYTREDVVEIHCHGGLVSMKSILQAVIRCGARLAEPGEFTKRAFLNGRLDLSQAEAVIDVIRAKTDVSLKLAVNQLDGRLSHEIFLIRQEILSMIAHLEAVIDFPEEDIEQVTVDNVALTVHHVSVALDKLLSTAQAGRILRDGLQAVIIGKPNVGKSSLLNALLREQRAIVTDIPGTTRDVIEEFVNIGGIPLKLADTAGIRDTDDIVEKMGVDRAIEFLLKSDLVLVILDASMPLSNDDKEILMRLSGRPAMVVVNKTDLPRKLNIEDIRKYCKDNVIVFISVINDDGINKLEQAIVDFVYSGEIVAPDAAFVHNVRHIELLEQARQHINDVQLTIDSAMPIDCMVIDLRLALDKLGRISGETIGEDIINEIFSRFCIGK